MNIFILVIILLLLSFKSFFDFKVKKQRDALAKKVILEEERTRIAMDLHDDIGGNLTALSLMSALLKEKEIDAEGKILIDKISEATDQMVNEMNEIVWALNVSNDYLSSTIYYIRQHASKLFFESGIAFDVTEPQEYAKVTVGGKIRRNIFLITKEIFNNIIKYASSSKVEMDVKIDTSLVITISDNGVGLLEKPEFIKGGMGHSNMLKRAAEIGATMSFNNQKGYTVVFSIPFEKISQTD